MRWEVCELYGDGPSVDWRVEAFDEEGRCHMATFSGPLAEVRAREYAAWKNDEVFVVMRPAR
jgi:hypothetical protein